MYLSTLINKEEEEEEKKKKTSVVSSRIPYSVYEVVYIITSVLQ